MLYVFFCASGHAIKRLIKKEVSEDKDLEKFILTNVMAVMGTFGGIMSTVGAGLGVYKIYDEKHAVYNQIQDIVVVTGVYPSASGRFQYQNISAIGKNNQEYDMRFVVDGQEATYVERGDTIVVNFQYRNNQRIKDSIVANLTRDNLSRHVAQQNNLNTK